jgi:molybdopterin synthase catalytic subunit
VTVRVRLFAGVREKAGVADFPLELPEPASVADSKARLVDHIPALRGHVDRCAFAVNRAYVRLDHLLQDGDELAVIPPVSGG